jgi:modulator of FtsH protease
MPFSASPSQSRPLALDRSTLSQTYALFALALGLTAVGVYLGMTYSEVLLTSGMSLLLVVISFAIILSSSWWAHSSPLNYLLFALFPLISGITVTPYLILVTTGYTNGGAILLNALVATTLMAGASALFALTTGWNLAFLGRTLLFALLGLLAVMILQLFIPALRLPEVEVIISGAGVIIFALFTAYDVQRVQQLAGSGANPFVLALSLYLDIFNLFLMILRFMTAISGRRD